jgi:hypothetical protein
VWLVAAALLTLGSLLDQPRTWKGVMLGGLLLAGLLSDFQIALYAAIWLTVYAAWRLPLLELAQVSGDRVARFLARQAPEHPVELAGGRAVLPRKAARGFVLPLAIAAIVAGVPFLLVYYPALARADALGYPRPRLEDMLPYSFRLEDYVNLGVIPYAYGFDLLGGALLSLWLAKRSRVWLVGGIACLLLALGPTLQPTDLPGPFAILGLWPPLAQFRTPSRLTIPAALGLSVVFGMVLAAIFSRMRRAWLSGGLVALAVIARLAYAQVHDPLGVQTYPAYATYQRIAAEPGRFTLIEVPFGVRSGLGRIGEGGEVLEYYQHVHGKPLLNGMIARLPASVFESYAARPSLLALSGEPVEETTTDTRSDLSDVIAWSQARYVLLHRSLLAPEEADSLERLLDTQPDLRRQATEADLVVYAVR